MTDSQLKERNEALCQEWMDWHDSEEPQSEKVADFILRLTLKYDITKAYVYQILKKNSHILLNDKNWRKLKRIFRLYRLASKKEESSKDVLDLLEQLRKEDEGDKSLIDNSKHITNVTVNTIDLNERIKLIKENRCSALI